MLLLSSCLSFDFDLGCEGFGVRSLWVGAGVYNFPELPFRCACLGRVALLELIWVRGLIDGFVGLRYFMCYV